MGINVSRTKDTMKINLDVPPNVQNIASVYDEMSRQKYNRDVVEVVFPEGTVPDLAFVQLLVALKKEVFSDTQKIRLIGALDEPQKSLILALLNDIEFGK